MTFDDNACIRYLMKEMDPSEEMLFEKKMMEDEDLLIEVESLRKVNTRLAELPKAKPPAQLTRKILQEASDHYKQKEKSRTRSIYITAAATILVFFFAGAFWIYEQDHQSAANSGSEQAAVGSATPTFDLNTESTSNGVSPWVDHNQKLHFNDRFDSENAAAFDSIFKNSYQRLQPLQNLERRDDRLRGLHLTGSGSN